MNIREYNEKDFKEVKKLYMNGRLRELSFCNITNIIDLELDQVKFEKFKKGQVYIMDVDGALGGFVCINSPEVSLIYVAEEFVGQGIGRKLLEKAVEEIKKIKKPEENICLDLLKENEIAKGLYSSVGFKLKEEFHRVIDNKTVNIIHMAI